MHAIHKRGGLEKCGQDLKSKYLIFCTGLDIFNLHESWFSTYDIHNAVRRSYLGSSLGCLGK